MSDIVERLKSGTCGQGCGTMTECVCATAEDAADEITRLRNELHIAQEWSARVIDGQEQDIAEITRLRAEVEDLGNRLHHVHRLWANNEHALRAKVERLEGALSKISEYEIEEGCPCNACQHSFIARAALGETHE